MPERRRGLLASIALTVGRRAIGWLVIAVVASLVLGVVELAIALFLQLFLRVIGLLQGVEVKTPAFFGDLLSTPARLALGLTLLALVRSVTLFFVNQSGNVSMEMINARLRRVAIWEALLHPAKHSVPAAAVNARVGDLANKASQFCYAGSMLVSATVQAVALGLVMIVTAAGETAVAMVGLVALAASVLRVNRAIRRISANVPKELRVLTEGIERIARNVMLVRVLRTERIEHARLTTSIDSYARHLVGAAFLANLAGAATPFAGIVLIVLIVGTSQSVLHTPGVTLLSFLYLFVRFVQTMTIVVQHFSTCNTTWPTFEDSLEYVRGFRDEEIASAMLVAEPRVGRAVERAASAGGEPPAITVHDVTFAYPGGKRDVLRSVSAEAEKGSQLAIVGPSGCGKSTLLGLVLGLFEPKSGEIRIGGRAPSDYFADPTVRVGYVGAEAFLVAGTIRENLRYGLAAKADDQDLWDALARAELEATVRALPEKLEYAIAEDGSGLSAGQKQRLCLARALLNHPHVLILDEVSANLDVETEKEIAESLRKLRGSCTILLVSHREGIYKYADRVITLGGGA